MGECFDEQEIWKILSQVMNTLIFLRGHKLQHRDLKPGNILWTKGDKNGIYKLADFGTAYLYHSTF